MADIDQFVADYFDQRAGELAKPFPSAEAARQDMSGNFATHVWDEITVQPFWNAVSQTADSLQKYDPSFEPLSKENLKGFEQYSHILREARNQDHAEGIKARITRFAETKQRIDENGGILSGFVSEIFNPINYIIPEAGLLRGVGAIRGFGRGVLAGIPSQVADETLRQGVDPTATLMESGSNIVYGLVFSGLLGSGAGLMKTPNIDYVAEKYRKDINRHMGLDEKTDAPNLKSEQPPVDKNGVPLKETPIKSEAQKIIDEVTGAAPTVAKAAEPVGTPGIYKLAESLKGIVRINAFGDLISSGVAKWESFGHTMIGELDLILNKNKIDKLPTEASLYLGNGMNIGRAIEYRDDMTSIFGEYLGGGLEQFSVAGLNVPVTGRRMADWARGIVGSRASDGLMTYPEFKGMVYRSLKEDKIEVPDKRPDGTVISPREKEMIYKATESTSKFFDDLGIRFTEAGYLRNKQNAIKHLDMHTSFLRELQDRLDVLYQIEKPTGKDLAEIAIREEAIIKIGEKITEFNTFGIRDESFYQDKIRDIAASKRAKEVKAGEQLDNLRADLTQRRLIMEAELTDLLNKDPADVSSADLRRMSYLEGKLADSLTEKQQAFIDRLRKQSGATREVDMKEMRDRAAARASAYMSVSLEELPKLQNMQRVDPTEATAAKIAEFEKLKEPGALDRLTEEFLAKDLQNKNAPENINIGRGNKGYSQRQADYLFYLMQKEEEIAAIRKDIEDGNISFENLRKNYAPIIYDLDAIVADEAGDKIFRKKVAAKFQADSEANSYRREKSELAYNLGLDEATAFVEANDLKTVARRIRELENQRKSLREALAPEELQKVIAEQQRVRDGISERMAQEEAKLTPEQLKAAPRAQLDPETLKVKLAYLLGQQKFDKMTSGQQLDEIQKLIAERVNNTMNNILRQGELGELSIGSSGGASFLARRKINLPQDEIADFVVTDLDALSTAYAHRAGMASQITKQYGSRDATIGIYRALADGVQDLPSNSFDEIMKQVDKARNSMIDVRDYALGDHWQKDVLAWDRKAVRAILDWSTTTNLDNAVVSSLADVVRPITTFGLKRSMEFAFKGLFADMASMKAMTGELKGLTGEFGEVAGASMAHTYVNGGGVSSAGTNWMTRSLDKFSGFANGPMFIANGLTVLTEVLKRWTGLMSSHFLIEDAVKIANKTADEKTITNFLASSLSLDDANKIAKLVQDGIIEKPNYGYYANTSKWDDNELISKFGIATKAQIRRTIVTAGPANKPTIAQGFIGQGENRRELALARIPFHLMSWAFAANNKIMLSALQGRDANMFGTALTLIGMGGIVSYLQTPDAFWEKLTMEEKILRSVEKSGVFGIFTDVNGMVEQATRSHYGIRPMVGMDPPYGEVDAYRQFTRIAGAPTSNFVDLYKVFVDQDLTDRQKAKSVINMIPLTGAFYWKEGWQQLGRSAADAMN